MISDALYLGLEIPYSFIKVSYDETIFKISHQKKALLIIHGLFGMSDNWQSIGRQFSDFEVHLIDLRNHGRSPHSSNFNYDVMVEDLVQYIQEKELKQVILLGHSLGGKTAMELAIKYPELVEKLIVS